MTVRVTINACLHPKCDGAYYFECEDRETGNWLLCCEHGHIHPDRIIKGRQRGETYTRNPETFGAHDPGQTIGD